MHCVYMYHWQLWVYYYVQLLNSLGWVSRDKRERERSWFPDTFLWNMWSFSLNHAAKLSVCIIYKTGQCAFTHSEMQMQNYTFWFTFLSCYLWLSTIDSPICNDNQAANLKENCKKLLHNSHRGKVRLVVFCNFSWILC